MLRPGEGKNADAYPSDMKGARILAVDDMPEELMVIEKILEKSGCAVSGTTDGRQALEMVKTESPDLILLDIEMPEMSGYDICRSLKEDEETRDIPIIFITGRGGLSDKVKAFSLGAVDFIEKPFQVREIRLRVNTHLHTRYLQKRLQLQNRQLQSEIHERRQAEAALEAYRYELENRVEERTASLLKANAELKSEIIERKRLEEILQKSEAELSAIYDAAPILMLLLDAERKIRKANRIAAESSECSGDDLAGRYCGVGVRCIRAEACGFSQECRDCGLNRILQDAIQSGRHYHREEVKINMAQDGAVIDIWFRVSAIPLEISGENNILVCLEDITERKKLNVQLQKSHDELEMRVRRRTEALKKSEERLELTIAGANLGMWDWNILTNRVLFSSRWGSLLGYSPGEIGGHINAWENLLHPDDRKRTLQDVANNLSGKTEYYENEHRLRTKSGAWKWVLAKGKVVERDTDGNPVRHAGTHMDISVRKQAECEQRKAREAAEAANRIKSRFLANMSHEIRTPMNAIFGFAHLVLKTNPTPRQRNYMERIRTASHSLLGIIDDILDFSKIEAGRLDINRQPFRLRTILDNIDSMFRLHAEEKGIELKIAADGDIPPVLFGDPTRLEQILVNLTGNALKFTEAGRIILSVERSEIRGSRVRLAFSVKDTGIGIPEAKASDIFSPFTQVDDSSARRYPGTGLGLAISRQLVELMGGEIRLESEPGRGSVFHFTVLLETSDEQALPLEFHEEGEAEAGGFPEAARVLVVEDNEINREMMRNLLESEGIQVRMAENGFDAIEALKRMTFDAVLMDVQMSGMNGYEATEKIRILESETPPAVKVKHAEGAEKQRIPIIAMTANAMRGDRRKCLDAGMDDYIQKPIAPGLLFSVLKKWMGSGPASEQDAGKMKMENSSPASDGFRLPPETLRFLETTWKGLDFPDALKRAGGNAKLLIKLLKKMEKFSDVPKNVRAALASGNPETARQAVHALKGVAGNLSAADLYHAARDLESALKNIASEPSSDSASDSARFTSAMERFEREFHQFLECVRFLEEAYSDILPADGLMRGESEPLSAAELRSLLMSIYEAVQMNRTEAEELIESLPKHSFDSKIRKEIRFLENHVEAYDFDAARERTENIARRLNISLESE